MSTVTLNALFSPCYAFTVHSVNVPFYHSTPSFYITGIYTIFPLTVCWSEWYVWWSIASSLSNVEVIFGFFFSLHGCWLSDLFIVSLNQRLFCVGFHISCGPVVNACIPTLSIASFKYFSTVSFKYFSIASFKYFVKELHVSYGFRSVSYLGCKKDRTHTFTGIFLKLVRSVALSLKDILAEMLW